MELSSFPSTAAPKVFANATSGSRRLREVGGVAQIVRNQFQIIVSRVLIWGGLQDPPGKLRRAADRRKLGALPTSLEMSSQSVWARPLPIWLGCFGHRTKCINPLPYCLGCTSRDKRSRGSSAGRLREVPKRIAETCIWVCFGMVLGPGTEIWLWDASGRHGKRSGRGAKTHSRNVDLGVFCDGSGSQSGNLALGCFREA